MVTGLCSGGCVARKSAARKRVACVTSCAVCTSYLDACNPHKYHIASISRCLCISFDTALWPARL